MLADPVDLLPSTPKDIWFEPYRRPYTDRAGAFVASVVEQVTAHEVAKGIRKRRRKDRDQGVFEAIVAAIISDLCYRHLTTPDKPIAITRSDKLLGRRSRYRPTAYGSTLPKILDVLRSPEMALLEQQTGNSRLVGEPRRTTIKCGRTLIERIDAAGLVLDDFHITGGSETIVLKRPKDDHWDEGGLLEYADTQDTERMRDEMATINEWLDQAQVDFEMPLVDSGALVDARLRRLRRVFTQGRFDSGGRLFGGFWQGLSKKDRLDGLFIDGEEIIELDYGQMAARIVYGMAGVSPPSGDLYNIPRLDHGVDLIRLQYREGIKKLFNAMLFSTERLNKKPKGTSKLLPRHLTVAQLMDMVCEAHPAIASHFFSGKGHDAQFVESEILVSVLLQLREYDIVALPIHDAVLVAVSHADQAEEVMLECFHDRAGVSGVVTRHTSS